MDVLLILELLSLLIQLQSLLFVVVSVKLQIFISPLLRDAAAVNEVDMSEWAHHVELCKRLGD